MDDIEFLHSLITIDFSNLRKLKPIGAGGESKVSLCELKEGDDRKNVAVKSVYLNDCQAQS